MARPSIQQVRKRTLIFFRCLDYRAEVAKTGRIVAPSRLGPSAERKKSARTSSAAASPAKPDDFAAFQKEHTAFRRRLPRLLNKYAGQYVAFLDGRVVDHDARHWPLAARVSQKYPDRFVLVIPVRPDAANETLRIDTPEFSDDS